MYMCTFCIFFLEFQVLKSVREKPILLPVASYTLVSCESPHKQQQTKTGYPAVLQVSLFKEKLVEKTGYTLNRRQWGD